MSAIVRDYRKDDLDDVNCLLKESFSIEKRNFQNSCFHEVVVELDNKVVGYLLLTKILNPIQDKYYFLIDYMCISEAYRRKGLGRKLLNYVYEIAKADGAMYLQLTCSYFRVAAHHLYKSCGFFKRESDIFRKVIV